MSSRGNKPALHYHLKSMNNSFEKRNIININSKLLICIMLNCCIFYLQIFISNNLGNSGGQLTPLLGFITQNKDFLLELHSHLSTIHHTQTNVGSTGCHQGNVPQPSHCFIIFWIRLFFAMVVILREIVLCFIHCNWPACSFVFCCSFVNDLKLHCFCVCLCIYITTVDPIVVYRMSQK